MRAIAPNADFRPFHNSARSASSAATRTLTAPWPSGDIANRLHLGVDSAVESVDLDEQHCFGVARIPGAHEVFDGCS